MAFPFIFFILIVFKRSKCSTSIEISEAMSTWVDNIKKYFKSILRYVVYIATFALHNLCRYFGAT